MLDVKRRGLPIVLISHNMPHVFEVADRIHIHRLGRRIAVIDPKRLLDVRRGRDHDRRDAAAGCDGAVMTRSGVLTGGTWCLDRNLLVDVWPAEDGRADVIAEESGGGGSAAISPSASGPLTRRCRWRRMALIGDDADGRFLLAFADRHGIDRTRLRDHRRGGHRLHARLRVPIVPGGGRISVPSARAGC